jgi:DNA-binding Lrp family transcriptional regulator
MVKASRDQVVEDERKVITQLQKNCKENMDTIAKHCGLSKQKVSRIIKRMEQSHKIWGYSAIVDETQGLQKFILFQKRTRTLHDTKEIDELARNRMDDVKKELGITVQSTYYIHGEYDWVTIFTAKDIRIAKKFADVIMRRYPDTQTIRISEILFTLSEQYILNPNPMEMKDYIM